MRKIPSGAPPTSGGDRHSYIVYGPLAAGATSLMFEAYPTTPSQTVLDVVEKYRSTASTPPHCHPAMMKDGDEWPKKHDLSSLRILGTVGEPINPKPGCVLQRHCKGKCPIVDTCGRPRPVAS